MRYASVFDGIGAAHVAWQPLGWKCAWTAEIDPFPSAVVEQRWGFENRGDVTKFKEWTDGEAIDLLVGGSPCQSFSVAGLRRGLLDPRGGLMLTFLGIAQRYRPRWVVWENVPGVLSSGQGRDFGSFLGALAELGYGFAYRVLDAQWFGVAQRRRRVFAIGCLGDMRSAAQVLFERESVCRDNPPSREKGQEVARSLTSSTGGASAKEQQYTFVDGSGNPLNALGKEVHASEITGAITARSGRNGGSANDEVDAGRLVAYTSDGVVADPISANEGRTYTHEGTTFRLHNCVSQPFTKSKRAQSNKDDETWVRGEVAPTFNCFDSGDTRTTVAVAQQAAVRRLTVRECERLQGFPDDYTAITYRKKPAADGPRYKAIGNSMAVPVMRWIGERIGAVG